MKGLGDSMEVLKRLGELTPKEHLIEVDGLLLDLMQGMVEDCIRSAMKVADGLRGMGQATLADGADLVAVFLVEQLKKTNAEAFATEAESLES